MNCATYQCIQQAASDDTLCPSCRGCANAEAAIITGTNPHLFSVAAAIQRINSANSLRYRNPLDLE